MGWGRGQDLPGKARAWLGHEAPRKWSLKGQGQFLEM